MDASLIVDPPALGTWNMAVDEALFQSAQRSRNTTLRFYQWLVPTLTLGYFQAAAERQLHTPSLKCPLVRRSTGGGAIVHDRELTYSLIVPLDDRCTTSQKWVHLVHETLIETLSELGITVKTFGEPASGQSRNAPEPFLCFCRRTADDLVIGEHKIMGSAQRRSHGTLLQHGSLLLNQSEAAPELPGVADLAGFDLPVPAIQEVWTEKLARSLQLRFQPATPSTCDDPAAREIERLKFGAISWNSKR